jgi:hypothetical protein
MDRGQDAASARLLSISSNGVETSNDLTRSTGVGWRIFDTLFSQHRMEAREPKRDHAYRLVKKERYEEKNKELHRIFPDDRDHGDVSPFIPDREHLPGRRPGARRP